MVRPVCGAIGLMFIMLATSAALAGEFGHGHLFVSQAVGEACRFRTNWIRAIDPNPTASPRSWIFADADDDLCYPSGLAFAPNRDVLCVMNLLDYVTQHRPDGSAAVRYDFSHGLRKTGSGIAFDALGACYISNQGGIVRVFPDGKGSIFFGSSLFRVGRS